MKRVLNSYSLSRMSEISTAHDGRTELRTESATATWLNKPANPDVWYTESRGGQSQRMSATLNSCCIRDMHTFEPEEFRYRRSDSESAQAQGVFYVPGEHDV